MASFEGAVLKIMVAKICSHVGYNAITEDPVNILVDVYRRSFIHLARHCKEAANNNRRVEPTLSDLIQAYDFVGISIPELLEHSKNVKIATGIKMDTDPELKPFNRIQRNLFVDDLLEAEKNQGQSKVDNDDSGENNDTGSDAEDNNMTPLLKDIYNEISTQFPNPVSPVKADKVKIKKEEKLVIPKLKITPLDPSIAEPPSFLPILDGGNPDDLSYSNLVLHPTPPPLAEMPRRGRQKGTKLKLKSKVKTSANARATANASAKAVAKAKGKTNTKAKLKANIKTQLKTKAKGRPKRGRQAAAKVPSPELPLPSPSPEPSPPTPPPMQASPSPSPTVQEIQMSEEALSEVPTVKQQQTKTKKKKKRSSNQFAIVTETVKPAPVESQEEKEWLCPHCNGPDDGDLMVGCDMCELWFHLRCTNLKKPPKDDEDWRCSKCAAPKSSSRSTPKPSASTSKTTPTKPKSARGRRPAQPSAEAPVKVMRTPKLEHHTPTPPLPPTPQPSLPAAVSEPQQNRPTVICTSQDDLCPECQLPDDGTLMIQCDDPFCAKWFHGKCVNVLMEPSENESWFCKVCVEKQQSAFQRRRRAI